MSNTASSHPGWLTSMGAVALTTLALGSSCGEEGRLSGDDTAPPAGLDTDDAGACPLQACGGDLQGVWVIRDVCGSQVPTAPDPIEDACSPDVRLWWGDVQAEGRFVFEQDGHYTMEFTEFQGKLNVFLPTVCLDGETCAEQDWSDEGTSFACATAQGGCECSWIWDGADADAGTWSTFGDDLYLDEDDAVPYCLDEDGLWIREAADPMALVFQLTPP